MRPTRLRHNSWQGVRKRLLGCVGRIHAYAYSLLWAARESSPGAAVALGYHLLWSAVTVVSVSLLGGERWVGHTGDT